MRSFQLVLCIVATFRLVGILQAEDIQKVFPGQAWAVKSPAEMGLNEAKLQEFAQRLCDDPNIKSRGCIVRRGYMVHAWGDPAERFAWASSSKPVIATLLFFAVQSGKLGSVNDKIADWGWKLSQKDESMTFAHLANMTSGYGCAEAPGEAWCYNDFAIQLYALTMEKVFGKSLNEAALECFKPLQFQDGDVFDARRRVMTTPRDFARIGWLWMNRGNWNGKQLLARKFFDDYMKPQVPISLPLSKTHSKADDYLGIGSYGGVPRPTEYGPGKYGFNWWFNAPDRGSDKRFLPDAPADTVMTIGRGGNHMVMMPSLGLLVAARGDWGNVMPGAERDKLNANLKLLVEAAGQ